MTIIDSKILMEAAEAKHAFEKGDYKTVHVCALNIADLAELADKNRCTPTAVEREETNKKASCTPANVSAVKETNDSENFKIKISGHGNCSRSGYNRREGHFSDNRSIAGDITIDVNEPKDLAKALAEIWAGSIFGGNRKA